MGAVRGAVTGSLGLILLGAAIGTRNGPDAAAGAITWLTGDSSQPGLLGHLLDPSRAALPDLRAKQSSTSSSSGTAPARGSATASSAAPYDPKTPATTSSTTGGTP